MLPRDQSKKVHGPLLPMSAFLSEDRAPVFRLLGRNSAFIFWGLWPKNRVLPSNHKRNSDFSKFSPFNHRSFLRTLNGYKIGPRLPSRMGPRCSTTSRADLYPLGGGDLTRILSKSWQQRAHSCAYELHKYGPFTVSSAYRYVCMYACMYVSMYACNATVQKIEGWNPLMWILTTLTIASNPSHPCIWSQKHFLKKMPWVYHWSTFFLVSAAGNVFNECLDHLIIDPSPLWQFPFIIRLSRGFPFLLFLFA